jgi:aspartyl-tRNA(Asn)/glutamyl-tRNA(Gln) amidotransferase subunit A
MRTRDAFRDALLKIARLEIAQSQLPAFTSLPGAPPDAVPTTHGERPAAWAATGGRTIASADAALAAGELSISQLVEEAYRAIEARSRDLNAFTYLRPREDALREAETLESELRRGAARGRLHGVTVSVKDVIHVRGMPTSSSSAVPDGLPEGSDAAGVARLRAAGAIVIGKTATHEFALGVTTPQSRNPWSPDRLAGGSSGGAAIALATGMGLGALGTDTRASIRVPAALCGLVGYKPTYGLVPTEGVVTLSWSMDHAAPMAKTVEDAALLLDVLAVTGDRTPGYHATLGSTVRGLRVGVPARALEDCAPSVADAFARARETLRDLGVAVIDIDEPSAEDFALANAAGLIISRVEAAAYHAPWRERRDRYTEDVRDQLDEARLVTGVEYVQAQRYRADLQRRMLQLFGRVDVLAMPTSKVLAPRPEQSEEMLLVLSENCVPWSLLGFPAISLPCGAGEGNLPIGLELVAAPYQDRRLLALSAAFESAARVSYGRPD